MPSAQLLLFYYIYQNESELYAGETAEIFGLSPMQISRAIKQLAALGLICTRKDGVRTVISSEEQGRALFEKAKSHLLNPVRKKIYVEHSDLPKNLPLSGYSALSELTMLGGSSTVTVAFYGKTSALSTTDTLVDNETQTEVEIWQYSPTLLSKHHGIADALSLAVSLLGDTDPRIEQCVEELLSEIWR
jgi:DNA-binding MarR family transcriptional regulator